MIMYFEIPLVNILVGLVLGAAGIGGFLLPIFYTLDGYKIADAMALSFSTFVVAGIIGAYRCYKCGNIDLQIAFKMAVGSIVGALAGALCNSMVSPSVAKFVLYTMVLFSGLTLLIKDKNLPKATFSIVNNNPVIILIGFVNALISAFSGASGTVLLVPLLTNMGIHIKKAIGISLFNSIFISLAATSAYYRHATLPNMNILISICMLSLGVGVMFGTLISKITKPNLLKNFVAIVSVVFSSFMLYKLMIIA